MKIIREYLIDSFIKKIVNKVICFELNNKIFAALSLFRKCNLKFLTIENIKVRKYKKKA